MTVGNVLLCLPSDALQHLTSLQMGTGTAAERLPTGLQRMRLQDLTSSYEPVGLAQELQQLPSFMCLTLDKTAAASLLRLPASICSLTLQACSESTTWHEVERPSFKFAPALSRLQQLQVLHVGCFLTAELFESLSGACLPRLHTFGFQLPYLSHSGYSISQHVNSCGSVQNIKPDEDVRHLAAVFPNVQTFKIFFQDGYQLCDSMRCCAELEAGFMTPYIFPRLRYVVCCCGPLELRLKGVFPACSVILKYSEDD